jgi:hypothetical protein
MIEYTFFLFIAMYIHITQASNKVESFYRCIFRNLDKEGTEARNIFSTYFLPRITNYESVIFL